MVSTEGANECNFVVNLKDHRSVFLTLVLTSVQFYPLACKRGRAFGTAVHLGRPYCNSGPGKHDQLIIAFGVPPRV